MGEKISYLMILMGLLYLAFMAGEFNATWRPVIPCEKVRAEIDVYRECMQSAGKTGCHMQVDDFRKYHQLKADLAEHCSAQRSAIPQS